MLGEHTLDLGLRSISVPSRQAGGCPCCHPGSSVRHSPWKVLLQLNGQCLSHWPEMAVTLDKSPAVESYWWFVTHDSRPPHQQCSVLSLHIHKFHREFILRFKKKPPPGDSVLIMNKFLFMSPGYKGTSRLPLGRENGLSSPVRNLRGSKHTGKAGLLSLFFHCCTQILGTVLLWAHRYCAVHF